jgi:hypothetical protein
LIVPVTGQLVCVMAVPGDTPTFPVMVALVQVTAVPARTAKFPAVPSEGTDDAPPLRTSCEVWAAMDEDAVDEDAVDEDAVDEDAVDEDPHARRDAASGTRRASRALSGIICLLQGQGLTPSIPTARAVPSCGISNVDLAPGRRLFPT